MSGPYGATHGWNLTIDAVVRESVPRTPAPRPMPIAAASVVATILLLLTTGFRFDISHGWHHIASASDYAGLPSYARDGFPQDLQRIMGSVWPLRGIAPWQNLHALSVIGQALAMFGCCVGLLRIAARLAAVDAAGLVAGALLLGAGYLVGGNTVLSGAAVAGGGFAAAQVALMLAVLSFALALDASLGVAVALLGLAFDADPAVALWGVAGLAGASIALARDGVPVGRGWLTGAACALVLATPALDWWAHEIAGGGSLSGGSASYFGASYGGAGYGGSGSVGSGSVGLAGANLLLAWTVPLQHWVLFGSTVAMGLAACSVLGSDARGAFWAFVVCLAVFAVGCALPLLTDNAWLAMLRPMAADAILQLVATAAAAAVVMRDLRGGGGVLRLALAMAIATCLLLHRGLLPLAALAMLTRAAAAHGELLWLERRLPDWDPVVLSRLALVMVLLAALVGGVGRTGLALP
jgi:hypothetical protein